VPDDAPWVDPVVVPDDLRDLQADVDAYHREQRLLTRRRRLRRITGSRLWQRLATPVAVLVGSTALAGVVFAVLTVDSPRPAQQPVAVPVAAHPAAPVGEMGGLVPDVTVRSRVGVLDPAGREVTSMSLRDLRPALVALVPLHCSCTGLLGDLAGQADEYGLLLVVVAPAASDAEIDSLPGQLHRGRVLPVFDANGSTAATYAATGVTVLTVGRDATVGFIRRNVVRGDRFELPLQQTIHPLSIRAG
jgi:hypothetical protein